MKLYTSSNAIVKAVNIQSLTDVDKTPTSWKPTSLSIDNNPIVGYHAPSGKSSQLRFQWDNTWYRIAVKDIEALPIHEQSSFFTTASEVAVQPPIEKSALREIPTGPFVTLVTAPGPKGLFVGTILRAFAYPSTEGTINVLFRDQEFTLPKDSYRMAMPSEIVDFFTMHSNREIWVNTLSGGFLATIQKVDGNDCFYKTYSGIRPVAEGPTESVRLADVYLPTHDDFLTAKTKMAITAGFEIGATVEVPVLGEGVIKQFDLDKSNQLIAVVECGVNKSLIPVSALMIKQHAIDFSNGVTAAGQFINSFVNKLPENKQFKEDFLVTIKSWAEEQLKKL